MQTFKHQLMIDVASTFQYSLAYKALCDPNNNININNYINNIKKSINNYINNIKKNINILKNNINVSSNKSITKSTTIRPSSAIVCPV